MITEFKSSNDTSNHLELIYYLLGKCNYSCDYCYWRDNRYKEESFDTQVQILDTLFQLTNQSNLFIFGGEPTLCTYITELLQYIDANRPSNITVELQTHGGMNPAMLHQILQYDLNVSVSIHYNQIKSKSRLFNNLKDIANHNRLHRIDFMFEDAQYDKQKSLFKLLKSMGFIDKILPTYGYMNLPKFNFQYSNSKKLKSIFLECIEECTLRETYNVGYNNSVVTKDASELYEETLCFKGWTCNAGKELMIIDNRGSYWPCTSGHFYDGDGDLNNLLYNKDKFMLRTTQSCICKYDKCNWDLYVNRHD